MRIHKTEAERFGATSAGQNAASHNLGQPEIVGVEQVCDDRIGMRWKLPAKWRKSIQNSAAAAGHDAHGRYRSRWFDAVIDPRLLLPASAATGTKR